MPENAIVTDAQSLHAAVGDCCNRVSMANLDDIAAGERTDEAVTLTMQVLADRPFSIS